MELTSLTSMRLERPVALGLALGIGVLIGASGAVPAGADLIRDDRVRMASPMSIQIDSPASSESEARAASDAAYREVDRLVSILSEWDPGSEISRVNAAAGGKPTAVGPETLALILKSIEMGELTGGAFDITFLPLGRVWDLKSRPPRIPSSAAIASARRLVDYRRIEVDRESETVRLPEPGMGIGLGGIAQGFIADRVAEILRTRGFTNFLIDVSGDLRVDGRIAGHPWRVGIRDPRDSGRMVAWVPVSDLSIVTSGDYERYFELQGRRYHHIMDPATGWPAMECQSVTVVSRDTGIADALATGLFVLGPERGIKLAEELPEVEALIVDGSGRLQTTSGLVMEAPEPLAE